MTCPVALCGGHVRAGHLMCRDCWSRVPQSLRREVNRSWSTYRRNMGTAIPAATRSAARKAYLSASSGAIDAAERSRP